MSYASLVSADLMGADLRGANLWEANLMGANLDCKLKNAAIKKLIPAKKTSEMTREELELIVNNVRDSLGETD